MYTDPSAGASGSCASTSACFSVACVPAGVPGGSVRRTTPANSCPKSYTYLKRGWFGASCVQATVSDVRLTTGPHGSPSTNLTMAPLPFSSVHWPLG
jgi:hypothetical protein